MTSLLLNYCVFVSLPCHSFLQVSGVCVSTTAWQQKKHVVSTLAEEDGVPKRRKSKHGNRRIDRSSVLYVSLNGIKSSGLPKTRTLRFPCCTESWLI